MNRLLQQGLDHLARVRIKADEKPVGDLQGGIGLPPDLTDLRGGLIGIEKRPDHYLQPTECLEVLRQGRVLILLLPDKGVYGLKILRYRVNLSPGNPVQSSRSALALLQLRRIQVFPCIHRGGFQQ